MMRENGWHVRIVIKGAGMGAKLALLSRRYREIVEESTRRVEYVELTTHPRFVEVYTSALMLAEP